MSTPLPKRIYAAVFLLSVGVLMLQIALNRIFSFTIWHHFAYMSISLALLGFGASGAMLAAFPRLGRRPLSEALPLHCAISAVTALLMLVVTGLVPLHPHRILQDPVELAKLFLYFSLVSVPFFFAGLAIALALREAGQAVNRLYFWDLVGAGLGCALSVALIDALGPPRVVIAVALLFAAAGLVAAGAGAGRGRLANAAVAVLLLGVMLPLPGALPFRPSDDKPVGAFYRHGQMHESVWSSVFRTDVAGWTDSGPPPGRLHALGLSSRYRGEIPPYRAITHDGGAWAFMYRTPPGSPALEMFRHNITSAPYRVLERPEVMVIGVGGGVDIVTALENGASRVTGVELDPWTIELIRETYRDFTGGIHDRPEVRLRASEGRHYARSTDERFDLIQLTGVDTWAALSSVSYVAAEAYLYTVEAYLDFFETLREGGMLSIGTYDSPGDTRHTQRFVALSEAALRRWGVARPENHIAVVLHRSRTVNAVEVLTQLRPFTPDQLARLEAFVAREGFETWYLPGRARGRNPVIADLIEATPDQRARSMEAAFLDLRPPSDDWPFFFSFYKWRHLFDRGGDAGPSLLAMGSILWVVMLGAALLLSALAVAAPLLAGRRAGARMPRRGGFLLYFACLGVGFIFIEISFVQRFILFLGYPTYSLTVLLFAFLTAAGLGAWASGWLPDEPGRVLPGLAAALTGLLAVYVGVLPWIFDALLSAPLALRIAVTGLLCLPLGGLLGMFFPYGVRLSSALDPDFVAWAWAANGCLTVVGSIASMIVAMTFGFTAVLLASLGVYWLGAAGFVHSWRRAGA